MPVRLQSRNFLGGRGARYGDDLASAFAEHPGNISFRTEVPQRDAEFRVLLRQCATAYADGSHRVCNAVLLELWENLFGVRKLRCDLRIHDAVFTDNPCQGSGIQIVDSDDPVLL